MSDVAARPAEPKRRRWLWWLAVASLALNALLIGVIARGLWHVRANVAFGAVPSIEATLPSFVETLTPDRRAALRAQVAQDRPGNLRPLRMEVRRARLEAGRVFMAEPFDRQAFIAAQKRLFDAESNLRLAIQSFLLETGERMTAAERKAYIQWRSHWPGRGGFKRGGPRGSGMDGERGEEPGSGPRQP